MQSSDCRALRALTLLAALAAARPAVAQYDLVLRGGRVLDPRNGVDRILPPR